jgi:predicted N-formylglutamate amidohydrolase
MTLPVQSIPGVCDVQLFRGAEAGGGGLPAVLLEVPHGATRTRHFDSLRSRLQGELPADLADFFHVNTDVGAPEVSWALAARLVRERPGWSVLVLCSEIARTFIDCNRVIDLSPSDYRAGGVTPGLQPYVRDPRDQRLLRELHTAYVDLTGAAYRWICDPGGVAVLVHTYAPTTVDVEVDDQIVPSLRRAYQPEVAARWPVRPEIDLIARDGAGRVWSEPLVRALAAAFAEDGFQAAISATYPLHPSTQGFRHVQRHAPRAVCLEVRRDLLVDRFTPFQEHQVDPAKVDRVVAPLARALLSPWRGDR